jgi:hypothetical protein
MKIEHISASASALRNDDHIAVFSSEEVTDIVVIDGGTSVAAQDYIDPIQGDVAWFVHAFTAALEQILAPGRSQQDCVAVAIAQVKALFIQETSGRSVPLYAWPIAAMTWVRIAQRGGATQAMLYSLGDCKTLLRTVSGDCVDLDPFVNPQEAVLQDVIATLTAEGIDDPVHRRDRMLPMLRARREDQNTAPAPSVLCLDPNGSFQARIRHIDLRPSECLLVMTDGFYRLVDTYGLYTDAKLMEACLDRGLSAQLDELRNYESASSASGARSVKAADDASAALWTMG